MIVLYIATCGISEEAIALLFKPNGAREYKRYAFLVITETDEDRRPSGSKAEYMDYFHKGQIVPCDVDGQPMEVGTGTKPGHLNCVVEEFDSIYDAINRAYEVGDYGFGHKKDGKRKNTWQKKKKGRKFRHDA